MSDDIDTQITNRKRKRKHNDDNDKEEGNEKKNSSFVSDIPEGFKVRPALIKNKMKRSEVAEKQRLLKKKMKKKRQVERKKEREKLGDKAPTPEQPKTIETTREYDETIVTPNDQEVLQDEDNDEFAEYFSGNKEPKVLVTTSPRATRCGFEFAIDMANNVFSNAIYRPRKQFTITQIVQFCNNKEFTDVIIFNEDRDEVNAMMIIHLPAGPTATFKLTSLSSRKEIRRSAAPSPHKPELILNNFNTRLGHTVGRMLASLFPQCPEFEGRRVVTFHNQRDFVFFRHHRYMFEGNNKARLQEIGPRFTLKLKTLQHGTFDPQYGEFEWVYKKKLETSRRRFFL